MDYQRADEFVAAFETLADRANAMQRLFGERYWERPDWVRLDYELQARLHATKAIADALSADLSERLEPNRRQWEDDWGDALNACVQLRGIIHHAEELAEILGPAGPSISAGRLHHWVWEAAASPWDAGLRRSAVQAAGSRVDYETQVKLRRTDVSGVDLARQAWSTDLPEANKPRLRPVGFGPPGSESYSSALNGAREFHAGAMLRIRNLATHGVDELDPQEALEQLAALSVLARWIETAEVLEAT